MRPLHPRDLAPPWVLFIDAGRPVSILPAGRLGEIADVRHMRMRDARRIVRLANDLHCALMDAQLQAISWSVAALSAKILARQAPASPPPPADPQAPAPERTRR